MRTEPRIGTKIYVKETGGAGEVKAHYFQYSITGQRLHSVLVLLDNNEYGTYSPDELTKDLHALVTRVTDEETSHAESADASCSGGPDGVDGGVASSGFQAVSGSDPGFADALQLHANTGTNP